MIWEGTGTRSIEALSIDEGFNTRPSSISLTESGVKEAAEVIGNMLSVNFSTPLAGPARSERIKQMSNNHVSDSASPVALSD